MQYRKLGKNKDVSVLGFGCMRLQTNEKDGKINRLESIKQVRYAIDNGINYIDTAFPYHNGESEVFLSQALLKGYREKIYLATKLPSWRVNSREDMDYYLDFQLKRLNTKYFDYYLMHALDEKRWNNCMNNGLIDFLNKTRKGGKVNNIGFSFHDSYDIFEKIIDSYDWDFCQIQLNYMDENYQAGINGMKYAHSKGIDVVVMEPLRGGALVNSLPKEALNLINSSTPKLSPAAWAFKYVWNQKEVSIALSGMNAIEQIDENIKTAETTLPNSLNENELNIISEIRNIIKRRIKVNCTDCKYCMPCPFGVNIPHNFLIYNNASINEDKARYTNSYNAMEEKERASNCTKCGKCEKQCPQNIEIREKLAELNEYFITS